MLILTIFQQYKRVILKRKVIITHFIIIKSEIIQKHTKIIRLCLYQKIGKPLKVFQLYYCYYYLHPDCSFPSLTPSPLIHTSMSLQKGACLPWISTNMTHQDSVRLGTSSPIKWKRQTCKRNASQKQASESETTPAPTLRSPAHMQSV